MGSNETRLAVVAVFLLSFVPYVSCLSNGFLTTWDDPQYITENPHVAGVSLKNVAAAFSSTYVANYAPLHVISYSVDYSLFGLDPFAFHVSSQLLHSLNSVLVLLLVLRVSGDHWFAVGTAMLFAVHPVQVESVAWLSQRKNVLSTAFALGACLGYMRFLAGGRPYTYALTLVLFASALLSKSSVIVVPLVLAVYGCLFDSWRITRLLWVVPFFLLAVVAAGVAYVTQSGAGAVVGYHGGSPYATALTVITVLPEYLRLILLPTNLSPIYDPEIQVGINAKVVLNGALLVAILGLVWMLRRKRRVMFWVSWAVIPLLPVLQIVPMVTLMNDRYLYLCMIGIAACFMMAMRALPRSLGRVVVFVVVIALGLGTFYRAGLWAPGPELWLDAIQKHPTNSMLHAQLGVVYQRMGKIREAESAYVVALVLSPNNEFVRQRLGGVFLQAGQYRRAVQTLQPLYDGGNKNLELITNLGYAYMDLGETRVGLALHREALRIDSGHANAIYGAALALEKVGDLDESARHWRKFLRVTLPGNPWRGNARARLRRIEGEIGCAGE